MSQLTSLIPPDNESFVDPFDCAFKIGDPSYAKYLADTGIKEIKHVFDFCRVSDAIGDDYKNWNCADPVFIDAPTGTGKTTFVYERLISDALVGGHGVLIVSNRIALSMQQKRRIYRIISSFNPRLLNGLQEDDITPETYMIGPVCVTTYQGLYSLFNPDVAIEYTLGFYSQRRGEAEDLLGWSRTLRYAVFDEIHFLYSDATFNSFCHMLLKYIPFVFRNVIRVYMTATSWDIFEYICKYENEKYFQNLNNPPAASFMDQFFIRIFNLPPSHTLREHIKIHNYVIGPNYSNYNLRFFYASRKQKDSEELDKDGSKKSAAIVELLRDTIGFKDKTIIFIDNKADGNLIYQSLAKMNISAAYVDKDGSVPENAKADIIKNERFDAKVLIATSALDSGINIADDEVKNLIIFYTDRTQFIQALGRKRLKSGREAVNVWAFVPSKQALKWQETVYYKNALATMQLLYAGYYNPNNPFNSINNIIKNIAAPILTEEDFSSFCRLSKNKHSGDYAYFGGLQKITTELYKSNPEPPTLTFINFNGQIACNFYVLGVILRKMNFLKQFVFPDKDGSIKDYRQVVGEWLGKPNILEEISRENEAAIQGEKAELEKLLNASLLYNLTDKDFDPIRAAIITAHINAIPDSELKKRNSEYKRKMGDKALSRLLSELDLSYEISSRRKNSEGKNNSVWHTWTISRL